MNMGLILPKEVIDNSLAYAQQNNIPINSLEDLSDKLLAGESLFMESIKTFSESMSTRNYWGHKNKMCDAWYDGTTGIPPLDDAIKLSSETGHTHHINRLMVLSNIMNLCQELIQMISIIGLWKCLLILQNG